MLILLGVWNGLIRFTLFLTGNIASVFVQFGFRQTFWSELKTKTEVPLYFKVLGFNIYKKKGMKLLLMFQKTNYV